MRGIIYVIVMIFILNSNMHIHSQSVKPPYWLLYDQGNAFMDAKEYGSALLKYQEAIAKAGVFPEAEIATGDIYREEGEIDLAIRHYIKAYNLRNSFYIPESKYDVLYKLSRIYEEQRFYRQMEDSLQTIVKDDKGFNQPATSHLKDQIESNYYTKGLDFVLRLYRFNNTFPEAAHSKLGWFYYKTGRFKNSVIHFLYSLIYKAGEASGHFASKDVDYQFTTLQDLLIFAESDKEVSLFINESDMYKDLYYLAGSVFSEGYPEHSSEIWKLLSGLRSAGKYSDLSRKQLKSPWIEPYLQMTTKSR